LYRRHQLPQWTIQDIIEHDFSYYFGIESLSNLKPTQSKKDYDDARVRRKLGQLQNGIFDPIICDCDFHIICGHHRHKMLKQFYSAHYHTPIICLDGATHDMVVSYYESTELHKQAQLDWMAENRAVEDYDYMTLKNGKVVI
jgi:hypothetical protein